MDVSVTHSWTECLRIIESTSGVEFEASNALHEQNLPTLDIKSLDRLIRLLDDPNLAQERSLLNHKAKISHFRNRLAPMHTLPTELFVGIILSSLDGENIPLWTSSRLASLCLVARRWYDIVVDTPMLWAIVNLEDSWIRTLSRSDGSLLTIYCGKGMHSTPAAALQMESRLIPEAYRIKNLCVKSYGSNLRSLWNLIGQTLPRALEVELLNFNDPVQIIPISLAPQPNLQRLALMGVQFSWSHAPSLPHLDSLSIETSTATIGQLVGLLKGCLRLRLLEVVDLEVPPGHEIVRQEILLAVLPRLEEVRLAEVDDCLLSPLLEQILAPSLERLYITLWAAQFRNSPGPSSVFRSLTHDERQMALLPTVLHNLATRGLDVLVSRGQLTVKDQGPEGIKRLRPYVSIRCSDANNPNEPWYENDAVWSSFGCLKLPVACFLDHPLHDVSLLTRMTYIVDLNCSRCSEAIQPVLDLLCRQPNDDGAPRLPLPRLVFLTLDLPQRPPIDVTSKLDELVRVRNDPPNRTLVQDTPFRVFPFRVYDKEDRIYNVTSAAFDT